MIDANKMAIANQVLARFAPGTRLLVPARHIRVAWFRGGEEISRRWMTRGQDFYPVWHRQWAHGGTASTALSQLVRWCQGKPVLSIRSWRYWASERCRLLDGETVDLLEHGGYPSECSCVLCHRTITGSLDWWSLDGISGPCCGWYSGCRQRGVSGLVDAPLSTE